MWQAGGLPGDRWQDEPSSVKTKPPSILRRGGVVSPGDTVRLHVPYRLFEDGNPDSRKSATAHEWETNQFRKKFKVKPLGVIWGKYPQYGPGNTIMFDDCRHNFLMNPESGLKIKAFRDAHSNRGTDRELLHLAKYLRAIAALDSFVGLDHRRWREFLKDQHKKSKKGRYTEETMGDAEDVDS